MCATWRERRIIVARCNRKIRALAEAAAALEEVAADQEFAAGVVAGQLWIDRPGWSAILDRSAGRVPVRSRRPRSRGIGGVVMFGQVKASGSGPPRPTLRPTPQQADVFAALTDTRSNVLVEARAGPGKSVTCNQAMWIVFDDWGSGPAAFPISCI